MYIRIIKCSAVARLAGHKLYEASHSETRRVQIHRDPIIMIHDIENPFHTINQSGDVEQIRVQYKNHVPERRTVTMWV